VLRAFNEILSTGTFIQTRLGAFSLYIALREKRLERYNYNRFDQKHFIELDCKNLIYPMVK
jgi:hypothetical protein